ncbi:MAG: hypothetical protein M1165_00410 [Candidatus Pacearchaeota archaeon]|nr:hypothetical protein [Candidatus Pacearchaeota archaeon]
MEIALGRKIIEIRSPFHLRPNLGRLEKELGQFFEQNKIEGVSVTEFRIDGGIVPGDYDVVPLNPDIEESLSGRGDYLRRLEEMGKRYGIRKLHFIYWCYHK